MKVSRALITGGVAAGGLILALGSPASAGEWCDDDGNHHDWCHHACHGHGGHHGVNVYDVDIEYESDDDSGGLLGLDLL